MIFVCCFMYIYALSSVLPPTGEGGPQGRMGGLPLWAGGRAPSVPAAPRDRHDEHASACRTHWDRIGVLGVCRPEKVRERMRVMALFQADVQSSFLFLGPGLRPGRCGWVGSPEGLGRGSRNTLPGPLAQRSAHAKKKSARFRRRSQPAFQPVFANCIIFVKKKIFGSLKLPVSGRGSSGRAPPRRGSCPC